MKITVEVSQTEIDEMGVTDPHDFADLFADYLDEGAYANDFEYVGYNVEVKVVD